MGTDWEWDFFKCSAIPGSSAIATDVRKVGAARIFRAPQSRRGEAGDPQFPIDSRSASSNVVRVSKPSRRWLPVLAFSGIAGLFLALSPVRAAEPMVWHNLVLPVDDGWTTLDLDSPNSYCAVAPDDTHRVIVTVVDMPQTPRSFKDFTVRGFFFGLRRTTQNIGPITEATVAGCPAQRFDMQVKTESGSLTLPTWIVLLDPGIYSVSLANLDDEEQRVALMARMELAPGVEPTPPARPGDSLAFKLGIVIGGVMALCLLAGIVVVIVILVRRGKRPKPPTPPPLPG